MKPLVEDIQIDITGTFYFWLPEKKRIPAPAVAEVDLIGRGVWLVPLR